MIIKTMSHHCRNQAHATDILLAHLQCSHPITLGPITSHQVTQSLSPHLQHNCMSRITSTRRTRRHGNASFIEVQPFRTALSARNVSISCPIGHGARCWTSSGREAQDPCCSNNRSCDARLLKGASWLESAEQLHRLTNNEDPSKIEGEKVFH